MNKLELDGMIAVLISPGFGAGWSTWNDDKYKEILCMDSDIVKAVIEEDNDKAIAIAKQKCPSIFGEGGKNLVVKWVKKGEAFEIHEYEGRETLFVKGKHEDMVA